MQISTCICLCVCVCLCLSPALSYFRIFWPCCKSQLWWTCIEKIYNRNMHVCVRLSFCGLSSFSCMDLCICVRSVCFISFLSYLLPASLWSRSTNAETCLACSKWIFLFSMLLFAVVVAVVRQARQKKACFGCQMSGNARRQSTGRKKIKQNKINDNAA